MRQQIRATIDGKKHKTNELHGSPQQFVSNSYLAPSRNSTRVRSICLCLHKHSVVAVPASNRIQTEHLVVVVSLVSQSSCHKAPDGVRFWLAVRPSTQRPFPCVCRTVKDVIEGRLEGPSALLPFFLTSLLSCFLPSCLAFLCSSFVPCFLAS